jgi:Mrp family chromosome partitioning ATPase
VLLVEGDIRRRTFTNYFPTAEKGKGVLAAVSGEVPLSEAVIAAPQAGVDVLLGDRSTVNAADLFSSAAFQRVLNEARTAYDYVVIDTPPVLVVPDARVIAQHADAVVYVVHWDKTARTQVDEGTRLFRSVNVLITGFVLSRIDPKGRRLLALRLRLLLKLTPPPLPVRSKVCAARI